MLGPMNICYVYMPILIVFAQDERLLLIVDDCHLLYKLVHTSDMMSSQCSHVVTHRGITLSDCQERVCDLKANVISYSKEEAICSVRMCDHPVLMLSPNLGVWQIYLRDDLFDVVTTVAPSMTRAGSLTTAPPGDVNTGTDMKAQNNSRHISANYLYISIVICLCIHLNCVILF